MIEKRELLAIDPASAEYYLRHQRVYALDREGQLFAVMGHTHDNLQTARLAAEDINSKFEDHWVVGVGIDWAESYRQRRVAFNHKELALWAPSDDERIRTFLLQKKAGKK